MAQVEVVGGVMWTKRIHGNPVLRSTLDRLPPEATVKLKVDGHVGSWRKMASNSTTGGPTPGLQPLGEAAKRWRELFRAGKESGGSVVDVELAEPGRDVAAEPAAKWEEASPQEREAAWAAFRALRQAGWRSQAPYGSRDELHERDP